jgi:hypothetical protein
MNSIPVFVGLDYHQKAVQICVMDRRVEVRRGGESSLRLRTPLIEPDLRISRIRLSDWLHFPAHARHAAWPENTAHAANSRSFTGLSGQKANVPGPSYAC